MRFEIGMDAEEIKKIIAQNLTNRFEMEIKPHFLTLIIKDNKLLGCEYSASIGVKG